MNPSSFANAAPENSPLFALEQERDKALDRVIADFEEKIQQIGEPTSFEAFGRPYPVREGSVADSAVAEAQKLHKAAEEGLHEARQFNNYPREEAAARLESLLDMYEAFVRQYASFLEKNPDAAKRLTKSIPALAVVGKGKNAANEDRFIIKQAA